MKQLLFVCLFFSIPSSAATAPLTTTDYPIQVHVSSTLCYVEPWGKDSQGVLRLHATISGNKYVLEDNSVHCRLLGLGDYPARLVEDEHPTPYTFLQRYQFLFPDGKTRKFYVVGQSE